MDRQDLHRGLKHTYELLARFLTQEGHFSSNKGIVRSRAFMPNLNGETSIFGIDGLKNDQIIMIAETHIRTYSGKPPYGRAEIKSKEVYINNLKIIFDNKPERHANIVGWPLEKQDQKEIAIELARNATLILH